MSSGAHAVDGAAAGLNPHEIVAQIIKLLFDARLSRLADGHHADYGGNSDGDAQHSQYAAHFIPEQRHHCRTQQSRSIHGFTSIAILFLSSRDKCWINAVARSGRYGKSPRALAFPLIILSQPGLMFFHLHFELGESLFAACAQSISNACRVQRAGG